MACRQCSNVAKATFFPSPSEKVHRLLISGLSNKNESPHMPMRVYVGSVCMYQAFSEGVISFQHGLLSVALSIVWGS